MIQVQIASQLTATGVDGVRWVLVEVAEHAGATAAPPAAVLAAAQDTTAGTEPGRRAPTALSLAMLKLLIVGLGVGLALWVAQATLGQVRLPWWGPAGAQTLPRDRLPAHSVPGTVPAAPPASAAGPLVTAELS